MPQSALLFFDWIERSYGNFDALRTLFVVPHAAKSDARSAATTSYIAEALAPLLLEREVDVVGLSKQFEQAESNPVLLDFAQKLRSTTLAKRATP